MNAQERFEAWSDPHLHPDSPLTYRALIQFSDANEPFVHEWMDLNQGDPNPMSYQDYVEGAIGISLETPPGDGTYGKPSDWVSFYSEQVRRWRELEKSSPERLFDEQGSEKPTPDNKQRRAEMHVKVVSMLVDPARETDTPEPPQPGNTL